MELSLNLGSHGFSSSDVVEEVRADDVLLGRKRDADYLRSLEEEMKKIEPFRRELPLCMALLERTVKRFWKGMRSETSEEGTAVAPSIEGLFLSKRKSDGEESGEVSRIGKKRLSSFDDGGLLRGSFAGDEVCKKPVNLDGTRDSVAENLNGFRQLQMKSDSAQKFCMKQDNGCSLSLMSPTSVLADQGAANAKSGGSSKLIFGSSFVSDQMKLQKKSPQPQMIEQNHGMLKKQRRSWSPELHRRFLQALEKLGGAQAATPKQIREMMKAHDLTNDEVKSHLQKYRLNIRRIPLPSEDPSSSKATSGRSNEGEEEQEEYRENSEGHSGVTGLSEKQLVVS